ncbi:putative DapA-like lyase [Paraburkholderia aspalathi]|uniref:DapA-like lyase n=1 Tax=Paraburkholderia aspalathi TaxID=1324617 RepID=A0ABN7LVL7_9BURK|nr:MULTISPECIES: dihydrodipicolinate synthase family protein [Paraburkholderia]MBK3820227.1 dihydrodipicolinate synthase family protein [Paraburkholderia aspalathi]MBK3832079.1 dihydrodipicolinate synthase family protein [Paraburkholderia aspalathi]MBK3861786.1 dihydrodipicolinate synthase family protein [Paraburkholderia aspalathi]MCX4138636.1 dihydrodipicolinate synthase family protein [Paraburkholderia aspalathi]MDN7171326.1 dihydrodipicolinate synthase family protein [Paraburkholderia sp. 
MQVNWKGVFPAVTTKLKDDGSLDHEAIKAGLNRLIDSGVGGVVMMGMVGESAQLTPEEKRTVIKLAVETVNGRVPVIAGLAEATTANAVQYAKDAEALGVQGLMVFPGLTYKSDARETIAFYRTIAQASTLAILLYNNPRGYGVDLTPDVVAQLLEEPTIEAIKEESYDTTRVTDLISRFGDRLAVVCGVDDLVLESVALGVTCWVSGMANAVPKESVELLNLAVTGDYERARKLYRALIDVFHLDTHVKLVQYIKLAENITAGYSETVKAPRLKLEGEERQKVVAIVEKTLANVRALSK